MTTNTFFYNGNIFTTYVDVNGNQYYEHQATEPKNSGLTRVHELHDFTTYLRDKKILVNWDKYLKFNDYEIAGTRIKTKPFLIENQEYVYFWNLTPPISLGELIIKNCFNGDMEKNPDNIFGTSGVRCFDPYDGIFYQPIEYSITKINPSNANIHILNRDISQSIVYTFDDRFDPSAIWIPIPQTENLNSVSFNIPIPENGTNITMLYVGTRLFSPTKKF